VRAVMQIIISFSSFDLVDKFVELGACSLMFY